MKTKPKKYTAETLEDAVNAYFDKCEENGVFPDDAGMRLFLNISDRTEDNYMKDEELSPIFTRARSRRESWLAQAISSEPKLAQGLSFLLKQKKNGGYTDRPDAGEPQKLIVELHGVGAEAFK